MPIYEYRCNRCQHDFELLVRSSGAKAICPECDGDDVKKRFSVFGYKSGGTFVSSQGRDSCASCSHPTSCGSCRSR